MSNEGKSGLLVGGAIGVAVGYFLARFAGEEERPPIIVRGGSLKIQSGDETSNKQSHKKGKAWHEEQSQPGHWRSNHDEGRAVVGFSVRFVGTPNFERCPALSVTQELALYYTAANGQESKFTITLAPDDEGALVPEIIGSGLTPKDQTQQNPYLVYDEAGNGTLRVEFKVPSGTVNCVTTGKVKIKPLHE